MLIVSSDPTDIKGKRISKITDIYGHEYLTDLCMIESLVIHFDDDTRITLALDHRGNECYISQYLNKPLEH